MWRSSSRPAGYDWCGRAMDRAVHLHAPDRAPAHLARAEERAPALRSEIESVRAHGRDLAEPWGLRQRRRHRKQQNEGVANKSGPCHNKMMLMSLYLLQTCIINS